MPSVAESLVDAVITHLDGLTLSMAFTPAKLLVPVYARDDLDADELEVTAHAGPILRQRLTRGGIWIKTYSVGLVIRYASDDPKADLETKAGELQLLAEEIMDAMGSVSMAGMPLVEIEQDVPFDLGHVQDNGLMKSEITLRYKGF